MSDEPSNAVLAERIDNAVGRIKRLETSQFWAITTFVGFVLTVAGGVAIMVIGGGLT